VTWIEAAKVVGAVGGALGAAGTVGALAWRMERRARRIVTAIAGDGVAPPLLERVDQHGRALEAIQAQLRPNHGGSLHDVVVRIDERTLRIEHRLDDHLRSPHPPGPGGLVHP
jgi:hypothetical protein